MQSVLIIIILLQWLQCPFKVSPSGKLELGSSIGSLISQKGHMLIIGGHKAILNRSYGSVVWWNELPIVVNRRKCFLLSLYRLENNIQINQVTQWLEKLYDETDVDFNSINPDIPHQKLPQHTLLYIVVSSALVHRLLRGNVFRYWI